MANDKSRLDPVQIAQRSFDEELGASRVHMVDADMAIELSAEDGDSVITKVQTVALKVMDGQIVDLSMYTKVCLVGAETADLVLVLDNEEFMMYNLVKGVIKEICLTEVKVVLPNDAYLMVQ